MSQGPMSNSPSKGGTMRSQAPTSYQSPFGSQSYRTQTSPSKGGQPSFGGPAYQQPGQFGGQIMNRPMQSPGGKGGYQQPMVQRPMPYPGGKGGGYQRPPTPFGYGQPTFAPQQFSGYGQPSNIFSFNSPHYQPYMPQVYDSGQTGQSPDIGNNPMTPQPEVMAQPVDQQVAVQTEPAQQPFINAIPPELQTRPDPYPATGYNPSMPIGGKGGSGFSSPFRAIDPYGPGGSLEGQPRPTFPDPTQPQGPQGTVQSVQIDRPNPIDFNMLSAQQAARSSFPIEHLISEVPPSGQGYRQQTTGAMNSGLGSLFNSQQLAQKLQKAAGDLRPQPYMPQTYDSGQKGRSIAQDRAAYAASRGGIGLANPRFQNMR